jgi:hypothetical protein
MEHASLVKPVSSIIRRNQKWLPQLWVVALL